MRFSSKEIGRGIQMLKKGKHFIINILIITVSLMLGLALGEVAAGLMGVIRYETWLEMSSKGYMQNQRNVRAWGQTFSEPIFYSFDEKRNRITSADSGKSKSAKNVLLLGDSFTFGLYLHDSLTIVHQLNSMSADSIHFINGGVGGTGTADHYYHLEQKLTDLPINDVVLLLNTDDVDRMIAKNLFLLKDSVLIESQRWSPTTVFKRFNGKNWHANLERYSRLYALLSKYMWNNWFFYDDFFADSSSRRYDWPSDEQLQVNSVYAVDVWIRLINKMKQLCDNHEVSFRIITTGYPANEDYSPRTAHVYSKFDSIGTVTGIEIVDIREHMNQASGGEISKFRLLPDSHPNGLGAKEIANQVLEEFFLKKDE
ncbi:SGNH/GDSL hydrolase family protein [bacterium]|nr:MAG: SGNH/GDSL hydrolase family protein [bacterium]